MEINKVKLSVLDELERWRDGRLLDSDSYKDAKAAIAKAQKLSGELEKHETQDVKEKADVKRIMGYLSDVISFAHKSVLLYETTRKAGDDREESLDNARKKREQAQAAGIAEHVKRRGRPPKEAVAV